MSKTHKLLRIFRLLHLYIGIFIAPMLLFFAFTGALQTFSLHETTPGRDYTPPKWIALLAQVHKKQTPVIPVRKAKPAAQAGSDAAVGHGSHHGEQAVLAPGAAEPVKNTNQLQTAGAGQQNARSHLPLKIFFLLVSVGLFTSTLTGIYMSYKYTRRRLVMSALLIAGVIVPLALLPF